MRGRERREFSLEEKSRRKGRKRVLDYERKRGGGEGRREEERRK